jgi:hypothetical protein
MKPWEESWTLKGPRLVSVNDGPGCDVESLGDERIALAVSAPELYRALESLLEEFRAYRRHGQDALSPLDEFIKAEDVMRKARGEA